MDREGLGNKISFNIFCPRFVYSFCLLRVCVFVCVSVCAKPAHLCATALHTVALFLLRSVAGHSSLLFVFCRYAGTFYALVRRLTRNEDRNLVDQLKG